MTANHKRKEKNAMGAVFGSILADTGFQGAFLSTLILIFLGYALYNAGILESRGKNMLTAVIWKIAVPCMAFDAFMAPFDSAQFTSQIYVLILSFVLYFTLYCGAKFLLRRRGGDISVVGAAFCAIGQVTIFSMPILLSMYNGQGEAVLSISMMTLPFRVMVYVVAFFAISGLRLDRHSFRHSLQGILLNPIMIGMLLGLFIWLTQGIMPLVSVNGEKVSILRLDQTLPALYKTVTALKALVGPLSMLLIGMSLADSDIKSAFRDRLAWLISLLRTLIAPLFTLALICLAQVLGITHFSGETVIAMVIGFAAPASATVSLYAIQYNRAPLLASRICLLSTLMCVITLPLSYLAAKAVLLLPLFA